MVRIVAILRDAAGITLQRVLVIVAVAAVVLGVAFLGIDEGLRREAARHSETQAYYTALSVTQGLGTWIVETNNASTPREHVEAVEAFIADVRAVNISTQKPKIVSLPSIDMPQDTGFALVSIAYEPNVSFEGTTVERYVIETVGSQSSHHDTVTLTLLRLPGSGSTQGGSSTQGGTWLFGGWQ
ncbi:MAG: hypothetical protein LBU48_01220 [Coriobacteriales bacterium]|jgi:hypothetical protein|nr:hypothetical protein [Coriobacteriales bacterium]